MTGISAAPKRFKPDRKAPQMSEMPNFAGRRES